ncbi:MAG TPA: HAD-IA family hydrolase [Candidatus Saccharimonadales bacterium]|nr:HAD-IA family hydrolase [Candidatus Saccharimonadales bacterium]
MDSSGGNLTEEMRLGRVLQLARKSAGLTQQGLCQKSGLSYSTLAKIERGAIRAPSVFTIKHLAATLGVSLDELLKDVATGKSMPAITPETVNEKKISRNGVRFVYFDMNGCLVQSAVTKAAHMLAGDSGVTPDIVEAVFWQFNNDVCRGDKSIDELNTVLAERVNMIVDWNKYYLAAVEATPGIADLVEWVAENYRLGVLTNTLPGLVGPMLENGILPRVHYDVIIDSSEVHALKPEPEMFQIAAERSGMASPHEILLVDDDQQNLSAAAQLGWQTISFHAYQAADSIVAVSTALQPAD